ncbi:rod shape-determining protein MreD [Aureisphaera sp. CAU 1614]|uniref:Rod shape-determining protein MreD n=1 Tax=Halomarinibacterium sedimenti TaxID=2857106 RepID=A0A9X1JUP0_9FLAO|nr:rod shape-determining protein MreD [Halomarinibacterium sedimenti]MBW2936830.1 rod shape-determining protein MreD [Halomarinibacterium sedimenti]
MWNNEILINTARFLVLILLQVVLLDHINFLGYVNPYLYIYFILLYPLTGNKSLLILLSFLLGLSVDMFNNSGGIHAGASVFIAWIRPLVLKYSFGVSYEYNTVKINTASFSQQLVFIVSMVFIHHLILFSLEIFNTSQILFILKSTLFSGIFTTIIIFCTLYLFGKRSL